MLAVILCWVIFRSESVTSGINFIASMFGLNGNKFIDTGFIEYIKGTWTVLIFALIGIFPVVASFLRRHEWLESLWLCFVFVLGVLEVIGSSYNPFIYFNF